MHFRFLSSNFMRRIPTCKSIDARAFSKFLKEVMYNKDNSHALENFIDVYS